MFNDKTVSLASVKHVLRKMSVMNPYINLDVSGS